MNLNPIIDHTIDPMHPSRPSHVGAFRQSVTVNGKERSCICYIPHEVRASVGGVFVLPESGVTAEELLAQSNWAELAETDEKKEKFIVYFLEPDGDWDLEHPEADIAYVKAVFDLACYRTMCCIHEAKNYLVGYRAGGAIAQLAAMDDPCTWAGLASVDAPALDAARIEAMAAAPCVNLDGYEDPDGKYGYHKGDFTVPAWLIADAPVAETAQTPEALHWRKTAGTEDRMRQLRPDTIAYERAAAAPWGVNQEKEAFRVWISRIENASADHGRMINRRLWAEFLRDVYRWRAEPGGDLRMARDPVRDLGMEYHYEEIGGWMREYYVYVPRAVRENPEVPAPLVLAMHGYTCSGEIYAGNTEWFKVAEENGFLVCFPSAVNGYLRIEGTNSSVVSDSDTEMPAWNILDQTPIGPDELQFFETMMQQIKAAHVVDESRIYATGHSMGSLMVQYLGMAHPEWFAAIAPCSGVLFTRADEIFLAKPAVQQRQALELPVWMFGGENEQWLLDGIPTTANTTGKSVHVWWDLDQMSGEKPLDFELYRENHGRWFDYVFEKRSVPMIRYTCVEAMGHSTMTEMSYRIWDEFFSKFSRNADGAICYA